MKKKPKYEVEDEDDDDLPLHVVDQSCTFTVDGREYTIQIERISDDMKIDPNNIEQELRLQPQLLLAVGQASANAEADASALQAEFDVWYSGLLTEKREELTEENPKTATVDAIKAAARSDPKYTKKLLEVNDAQRNAAVLNVAYKAVNARQFMLQNMYQQRFKEAEPVDID